MTGTKMTLKHGTVEHHSNERKAYRQNAGPCSCMKESFILQDFHQVTRIDTTCRTFMVAANTRAPNSLLRGLWELAWSGVAASALLKPSIPVTTKESRGSNAQYVFIYVYTITKQRTGADAG